MNKQKHVKTVTVAMLIAGIVAISIAIIATIIK